MTSLLLLPLMAAAGGHHGGGHGPRGYRNVDQWLQSLPEEQQVKARAILEEARPAIEDTRWRIRQKREELAHFDYAEDSSAETLSRLGWELQDLRDRLRLLVEKRLSGSWVLCNDCGIKCHDKINAENNGK